jgi:hypothetical protein
MLTSPNNLEVNSPLVNTSMMETSLASRTSAGLSTQHEEGPSSLIPSPHKRNRTQLSCTNCRQAKLKCDRQKPHCLQCEKKGRASLCSFPSPAARKKPTVSMQNRLKHLESLVKDVMGTGQSPSMQQIENHAQHSNVNLLSNAASVHGANGFTDLMEDTTATASSGQVLLGASESTYVGATHWAAILEDVRFFNPPKIITNKL